MNVVKKFRPACSTALAIVSAALAIATAAASSAQAALPPEVATSITAYQTDATTAIGLIMGAGVVIWGLLKLASKLGWR